MPASAKNSENSNGRFGLNPKEKDALAMPRDDALRVDNSRVNLLIRDIREVGFRANKLPDRLWR